MTPPSFLGDALAPGAAAAPVRLREWAKQKELGRASYDLKVHADGLVHPMTGDKFVRPNGMSLRPAGSLVLAEVLANFRGDCVTIIPAETRLPPELVLLHEHSDHYSLQTAEPVALEAVRKSALRCAQCGAITSACMAVARGAQLCERMTKFLSKFEVLTKDKYFQLYPMYVLLMGCGVFCDNAAAVPVKASQMSEGWLGYRSALLLAGRARRTVCVIALYSICRAVFCI